VLDARSRINSPGVASKLEELRAAGYSLQAIADELSRLFPGPKFSKASVNRYLKRGATEYINTGRSRVKRRRTKRNESATLGRCSTCGFASDATDPQALLRRAEKLLGLAEAIAAQAQADNDARLTLMAVDRANKSLETLARATGMIGGDGITVNIDQRRVEIEAVVRTLPTPVIELIALNPSEGEAADAIEAICNRRLVALPAAPETGESRA